MTTEEQKFKDKMFMLSHEIAFYGSGCNDVADFYKNRNMSDVNKARVEKIKEALKNIPHGTDRK